MKSIKKAKKLILENFVDIHLPILTNGSAKKSITEEIKLSRFSIAKSSLTGRLILIPKKLTRVKNRIKMRLLNRLKSNSNRNPNKTNIESTNVAV